MDERAGSLYPEPGDYDPSAIQKRGGMVGDLQKNYFKFFMTNEKIEQLLGHSTVTREYGGWYRWSECIQYDLNYFGSWVGGPSTLLLFCNIPGTNLYFNTISDANDYGSNIYEDQEELSKRHRKIEKRLKEIDE